jgi:hypothetical protein
MKLNKKAFQTAANRFKNAVSKKMQPKSNISLKSKTKIQPSGQPKRKKIVNDTPTQGGLTGYRPMAKGASSKTKGGAMDKSARQGFTGYTSKSKSKQNKYTNNMRQVLRG